MNNYTDTLNETIKSYYKILSDDFPEYEKNDQGHNLQHIDYVIKGFISNFTQSILYTLISGPDV